MKSEYDFSQAVQGRFYTKPEDSEVPHYLSPELETRLQQVARRQGQTLEDLLRVILEKERTLLDQLR